MWRIMASVLLGCLVLVAVGCSAASRPPQTNDPRLEQEWLDACHGGNMFLCDEVYYNSIEDSEEYMYGLTCGGRRDADDTAISTPCTVWDQ